VVLALGLAVPEVGLVLPDVGFGGPADGLLAVVATLLVVKEDGFFATSEVAVTLDAIGLEEAGLL